MKSVLSILVVVIGSLSLHVGASPTVQVKGGQTSIGLADDVIAALAACDVERVKPAQVKPGGERLRFPISSGGLDLDALRGEVEHRGGLALSCTPGVEGTDSVSLENFRIDALGDEPDDVPIITALATVNGSALGRIEFLILGGDEFEVITQGGTVQLRKARLQLAAEASEFLLKYLGLDLAEATIVGESSSRLNVRIEKGNGEDGDKQGNGPAKGKGQDSEDESESESS